MGVILVLMLVAAPGLVQAISKAEREFAVEALSTTRQRFLQSIEGLSESQWNFKPSPFRWSVGECAEHIAATEDLYLASLTKLLQSAPTDKPEPALDDEQLARIYTDRSLRRATSSSLQPRGRYLSRSALLEHFNRSRDQVISLARTTRAPLRQYRARAAYENLMDGYQWFLRFAGHCERHTAQIDEVKKHPNFPKE